MQKLTHKIPHILALSALLAVGATSAANAQVIAGNVRVRLDNGSVISVRNTPDYSWHRDPRLVAYNNYYWDPRFNGYVVARHAYGRHGWHQWRGHPHGRVVHTRTVVRHY